MWTGETEMELSGPELRMSDVLKTRLMTRIIPSSQPSIEGAH